MASQEEDNKLECISNVNKDQERYFLNVYKKHEYILNNKNETFKNKIESLIEVWKSVGELNLSQFDIRHVIQIMDWAKLHALNIVLTAEWNKFKATYQSTLLQEIEKAQNELLKLNSAFATRCKKLSDVVRNPWEDPVLMTLMKTKDTEIGPEEIEFFCVETAYIVSVRLKKLCESHCEDLALNLVTAFMNCNKLSKSQNFSLNATETQMWFIFDIYIALLYKFQEKQKIVILLKELTFEEGLQLVKRFAKKRVKISKIWKNCQRVAILATQMYLSQAAVKYTEELKEFLESYLEIYISLCSTESLMQEFPTCIRRISNLADAAGLYVFCDVIRKKAGTEMKPLVVEMYIRALTTDMNELERQKDGNETEKATATTSRLAEAFCNLADFLDEHVKVARECVLTAFSLEPTKERLENIETLARRSGFQVLDTGQEWKCKLHPPALPTDDVTWICPECGEWMCKPDFTAPIKINMALNEALQNSVLGISEALCDDLVVCLSNPRYQILSWFLPWADLHRLCIMYLQDSQTTKNFVTELKFVDIDYSIFKGIKREPMDELAGIERGYEQYLDHDFVSDDDSTSNSEDSMSQDSRPYSLGSDGAGDGPYLPMLPPQTKSDPKTLKSLRMFRPSLKRSRDKDPEEGTPEKLYKTDSTNASDSSAVISNTENISKTENNNSLSQFLSAVQYPPSSISLTDKSSNKEDSHSKNVKTATLPLLGGQVAKKEITTIQVNKQPLNPSLPKMGRPSLLINLVQTVIPQHQLIFNNTMETPETPPNQKSLNKLSPNGLSESSSHKTSGSKPQDYCLPNQESPALTEYPSKVQQTLQLKTRSFSKKSCPKILTISLEKLPVHQSQSMMENKLDPKQSTPTQADVKQSPQNISQTTQCLVQNLPHKLAPLEKQLPNQIQLSSPLNLDQTPIPLTRQEKVLTNSSAPKQLLNNPLQNTGLDQSTIQTSLPSTINPLPKNTIQFISLEQVQKEPVSRINPLTNHILDLKPPPKPSQVSTVNQLRIHLVNIETLKSSPPSSLGKFQDNSIRLPNQIQNRNHSIKQEQIQTSLLPNLQTLKSRSLPNQDQVISDLDHQPNLDQTQSNQVEEEKLQFTQLLPLQTLKSKFHLSQPQVQVNSLHQTNLDNSVKQEHLRATLQTPKSGPSHQELIQNNLLHQPSLEQKQKHSLKQEQTSQLPSLQILTSNSSPPNQDQIPDTLMHNPNLEQEQNHTVKKNQSQIIQLPNPHLPQPLTCPGNSPKTMQNFNSDLSQKNFTQPVDPNLSQKQSNSQEAVECNQKPSESCFKQPQKQPIKENVTVNKSHQLQKSHCNSVLVPNQKKQLVRQEILQTSCSLKSLRSESNYTQSLNLGQTKNHQTKQENLLENQKEQEDNSKCFSQDQTQNQSANREKLQISLPLNPPQWQSILKQAPHSEHIHSQMNTSGREKHRETDNYQRKEHKVVQHISLEQEVIHVTQEKLQIHPIPCQQQLPSNITQSPPLEQLQSPISKHQSQESLKVLRTFHKSNSDQSCKVMTNREKLISHSPNPNQSQNSSCSLLKAPSLSLSLDKLQTSRSIKNNLKASSNHNLEKATHQMCHNQNNVPLVSPKVGKVPCTLKKLPNPTISMEAEILPNRDKFQSSCTPSLSMETEPPSLEKLQARLWPGLKQADKVMDSNKQLKELKVVVDKTCQTLNNQESLKTCLEKKSCCTTLEVMEQNENLSECDRIVSELVEVLCNSNSRNEDVADLRNGSCDLGNVKTAGENNDGEVSKNDLRNMFTDENLKNMNTVSNASEEIAQQCETKSDGWLDISSGIFSDLSENKPEELFFQSSMDYANSTGNVDMIESHLLEELPKNFNLTENIRTYTKKSRKALSVVNKDCIEALTGDDILNVCKNVNSVDSIDKLHSSVQNSLTKSKELKVVLCRLSSNKKMAERILPNSEEHCSIKNKCDRGKTPPKNSRRRRSMDKSENKVDGKAPNLVQNHGLSPLQDINLRANPRVYSRAACCDLSVLNTTEDLKTQRVLTEQNPAKKKSYAKSVLANIPGLNDFQMIKPLNVNHIVNVVQVSGGRPAQNAPLQSSQTSTQVTPHIQRIGQPRISDQKPELSNSVTSTTHTTTTTTTARTTTTQPSTLINILSQQIIRPVATQANTVRRQTPLINILSQQIIRPSSTAKTANNSTVPVAETNQVKPVVTTEQTVINQVNNVVKNTSSSVKNTNPVAGGQGGTILQFICKSSLPKFQQAFGKTVYQNSAESSESVTATVETTGNVTTDPKKNVTKAVPVNVQPIQGSVIYSRQVPVGQTISLIPPGGTTRQVFRIATSNPEQISLVKDSVIHSKMSALLAAALQGRPKNAEGDIQVNCDEGKGTITRPTLVQGARIVKPVQLQLQSNTARAAPQPNLSSTTLEQLREFDMVYKQVKERSSTTTNETGGVAGENQEVTQQRISVTYVNQLQKYTQLSPVVVVTSYSSLQPAASPALSVTSQGSSSPCVTPASTPTLPKIATKTSKGKTLKSTPNNTTPKSSPIPKPQQKPQEDEHTTQRIFDILAEYAEQLRNSPDLNNKPAPRRRSNPPTNPSQNSKRKKSLSGVKKSGHTSNSLEIDTDDITVGSEDSSGGGMVQLSVTDDEQSQAATIHTTESSDNSSPPSSRQLILTESGTQSRNLIIADSSVGEALKMPNTAVIVPGSYIMPVSMVKGGQQIAVVSGGSKILATVPARSGQNMLLFQSFTNQHRKGAISAVKYSTIQPISGISSQSLAGVSAQPPVILPSNSVATAVALGQSLTLKKIGDDRDNNEQLLLTISPSKEESKDSNDVPQPDSSTSVSSDSVDIKIESDIKNELDNSRERIYQSYQKSVITNSAGTSVIATTSAACIKEEDNTSQNIISSVPADNIKAEPKSGERIHSVLVTACSSNGPMLSHITPRYRKPSETGRTNNNDLPNKEEFLHNGEKTSTDQKNFRTSATYYVNRMKKVNVDSQKLESEMQKQAAIERELRLQKSLSEECEDLGVDEPSTSDLFPEADLLFDSNHSPSFDQTSQDIIKRAPQSSDIKEEVKETMNLFSDDENSSSLRTDLFEYVEYQTVETALARQMMNGNNSVESGSSGCEDNTLLAKCATMSEVTLNSPILPEIYQESSLHKYKFKYSNRKKGERIKQSDFGEVVSSSEDTFGNAELSRINCEEDNFKVVHVAITKTDIVKEGETCELHCDEDLDSPSGRGARRSVRKLCSCCNGSQDGNLAKKRPQTSRPHTPAVPHKKAFLNKKR